MKEYKKFNRRFKCWAMPVCLRLVLKRKNPDLHNCTGRYVEEPMVLWPGASNNGNCFERVNFSIFLSANFQWWRYGILSACFRLYIDQTPSESFANKWKWNSRDVCTKLILLFETSDLMTAKLFRRRNCMSEHLHNKSYHQAIILKPREVLGNFRSNKLYVLKAFLSF